MTYCFRHLSEKKSDSEGNFPRVQFLRSLKALAYVGWLP